MERALRRAGYFQTAGLILLIGATAAHADIYVCASDAIRVFADNAGVDSSPIRIIQGDATTISECYDVALDAENDEIWVAHGRLSAFPAHASGNVPPSRSIFGAATGIGFAASVAVDSNAQEVVAGATGGVIATFSRTASGDAAPLRLIAAAGVETASGVFVDRVAGELFVTSTGATQRVFAFDRLSSGQVGPIRQPIELGASVGILGGIFVDVMNGELYVVAPDKSVRVYSRPGALLRQLVVTGAAWERPYDLVVTNAGEILAGDRRSDTAATDPLYFFQNGPLGGAAPTRTIQAAAPTLRELYGVTSSHALGCASGNVGTSCLFGDGFEF